MKCNCKQLEARCIDLYNQLEEINLELGAIKKCYERQLKRIVELKNENNNRFAKGFKQGQNSIKRKNESGCCCIINDNDEIESLCGLHRELVDIKIAKLKNEREILQSAYRSLRMKD